MMSVMNLGTCVNEKAAYQRAQQEKIVMSGQILREFSDEYEIVVTTFLFQYRSNDYLKYLTLEVNL